MISGYNPVRNLSRVTFPVTLHSFMSSSTRVSPKRSVEAGPLFLGGHTALDFMNTRMRVNGELVDFLQHDEDVLRWLQRAGFPGAAIGPKRAPASLVGPARARPGGRRPV